MSGTYHNGRKKIIQWQNVPKFVKKDNCHCCDKSSETFFQMKQKCRQEEKAKCKEEKGRCKEEKGRCKGDKGRYKGEQKVNNKYKGEYGNRINSYDGNYKTIYLVGSENPLNCYTVLPGDETLFIYASGSNTESVCLILPDATTVNGKKFIFRVIFGGQIDNVGGPKIIIKTFDGIQLINSMNQIFIEAGEALSIQADDRGVNAQYWTIFSTKWD